MWRRFLLILLLAAAMGAPLALAGCNNGDIKDPEPLRATMPPLVPLSLEAEE